MENDFRRTGFRFVNDSTIEFYCDAENYELKDNEDVYITASFNGWVNTADSSWKMEKNNKIEMYDEKIYKEYREYINKKFEFLTVEQNLKILDKQDLYDFFDSENINVARLNERQIVEEIKEKRKKLIKSDNETSAKKKLYSECEKIFGNKEKRNEYDEYLKYLKYIKVKKELEEIKSVYEITDKTISNEKSDNFNNIKKILKSEVEAKNVFIGFCEENNIPYDISISSDSSAGTNENNDEKLRNLSEKSCDNALNAINEEVKLEIKGRHDPVVVPRAVVVVESMVAITIFDMVLENMKCRMDNVLKVYKK